jgi:hypothetical protein
MIYSKVKPGNILVILVGDSGTGKTNIIYTFSK